MWAEDMGNRGTQRNKKCVEAVTETRRENMETDVLAWGLAISKSSQVKQTDGQAGSRSHRQRMFVHKARINLNKPKRLTRLVSNPQLYTICTGPMQSQARHRDCVFRVTLGMPNSSYGTSMGDDHYMSSGGLNSNDMLNSTPLQ